MKKISLPDVTLCSVTSVALGHTATAIGYSLDQIAFGDAVWISHVPCPGNGHAVRSQQIEKLTSRRQYSHFILNDLFKFIKTSYVLLVQWDGYVINGREWREDFLKYDYIGAVWPQFPVALSVGNGGFSLRSRRLLEVCSTFQLSGERPEDIAICHDKRLVLESDYSMAFAPPDVARQFSYEREASGGHSFGFHGVFNLPDLLGVEAFRNFYNKLERGLVGEREQLDLLELCRRSPMPANRELAGDILHRIWQERPVSALAWKALGRFATGRIFGAGES